ncbi:diguanylate phosphodiesterase [[Leptolyngbya] sp. PCC 7376]|uniref:EAL domain-containing protein n=1 Tax=[Leptolyngbya] sp. PCC 7376 TaxID=111781 RepID=UPI00029EDC1D|nr:EAL domain-containing protein [[Leptolyngbya] sp. PCC 7376]AFY38499.1 diguanylate phosphodiesterase [[Leptolyngbya] sp. PCC 7376]
METQGHYEGLKRRRVLAGEFIFKEGDPGDYAYIIEEGEVAISTVIDDKPVILNVLKQGIMFGELALVDGRTRSAAAVAKTDVLLTIVTKEQVNIRIESADPILRMLLFVVMRYFRSETSWRMHGKPLEPKSEDSLTQPAIDLNRRIDQAVDLIRMESELRVAIAEKQFCLHYQPIVNLQTGAIAGFEALIRWQSPSRGFIRPDIFIALAESTSLILPIGEWVIEESGKALKRFEAAYHQPLFMSINIASRQIEEATFTRALVEKIKALGIANHQIKLEILERSLFDSEVAQRWIQDVRKLGFLVALDDFGTGYSSLQYLNDYHLDNIKIDKSFVDGLATKPKSASLCAAMINLAKALEMSVIAEGIETAEQAAILKDLGCTLGQGYHFSRPKIFEEALSILEGTQPLPIVS